MRAQTATPTRKRKKRKRQGIKRGEGRSIIREAGEEDGGRVKARGEKEKASRKGERGEEERPANRGRDSNTKKGERGGGGRRVSALPQK
jgi:hypothetical protein